MGLFKKVKYFFSYKSNQLTKLLLKLLKLLENIKMNSESIDTILDELHSVLFKLENDDGHKGQLSKHLVNKLIDLNNLMDNDKLGLEDEIKQKIITECDKVNKLLKSTGQIQKKYLKEIKDENNILIKKININHSTIENKEQSKIQNIKNIEPLSSLDNIGDVKSNISPNNNDAEYNEVSILLKKINVVSNQIGKFGEISNEYLHDVKKEIKSQCTTLSNSVKGIGSNLDENKQLFISGTQSVKVEIDKVSKLIPRDVLKKSDFSFELDNKFRELDSLKEVAEELEALPAYNKFIKTQLSDINEKLENISVQSASNQESVKVPDEIQAVEDLAKYMRDGVDQFENMSRLYVSKISEFEKVEQIKGQHQAELLKAEKESADQGRLEAKLSLAKEIAETFPSEFKAIKSIFKSVITERYIIGEIINVTNENKNKMMPYFSMELELVEYEIISPALLIGDDIVFKAEIKKVPQLVNETTSVDETPELKADALPEVSEDATLEIKADALPDVNVDTTPEIMADDTSKFVTKED
ncbi:hypothetical protein [Photobacterium carnosum]|uniref:hypothetical protein n=1 Tax=Photobacterium carnosum TaxID=2023717 RepID=UPI001E4368AA|nr:hypothetical protein [Photobacterium carnosum]MCD9529476.1 hypothetical protein [Photobacterium carnosum]MCF2153821.1 hypothetical protein [Photobacterium carnosum]MCF2215581.1 hypothetical protein [Photobacterium carnosum]